jgi:phenylacetate-CoA ligase
LIPPDRQRLSPLLTPAAWESLRGLIQDPDAPRWTHQLGDRVEAEDLPFVADFRAAMAERAPWRPDQPPPWILRWARTQQNRCEHLREAARGDFVDWATIPTMSRAELIRRPERYIVEDEPFERLMVYETTGTTGPPLPAPSHPRTQAQAHALLEHTLRQHRVTFTPRQGEVAVITLAAQRATWTFPTAFSVWDQALLAKVNLHPEDWAGGLDQARRFLERAQPQVLTANPVALTELLRLDPDIHPKAITSTATALSPALRSAVRDRYACPVIDWYSCTETSAIAYSSPVASEDGALICLPSDLFVEVIDEAGRPLPAGELGELCVSGGRNPYLPFLRYRTGDHARWAPAPEGAADPFPRLWDLQGRAGVDLRDALGRPVGPVDLQNLLRRVAAFVQHELVQRADGSVQLTIERMPAGHVNEVALRAGLNQLFGDLPITVAVIEPRDDGQKRVPWRREG